MRGERIDAGFMMTGRGNGGEDEGRNSGMRRVTHASCRPVCRVVRGQWRSCTHGLPARDDASCRHRRALRPSFTGDRLREAQDKRRWDWRRSVGGADGVERENPSPQAPLGHRCPVTRGLPSAFAIGPRRPLTDGRIATRFDATRCGGNGGHRPQPVTQAAHLTARSCRAMCHRGDGALR
jgi:hypothetical protein